MDTYLPPIDKPRGIIMKLIYAATRRRFGKVLTPLKVHSARLPVAFGAWYGRVSQLAGRLPLEPALALPPRHQVARINVCEFCIDIGRYIAIQRSHGEAKLDALDRYRDSPLFSDAERAALDYVTLLAQHFPEREICEITWLVASEHVYNITNIGLNIHSDMLCDVKRKRRALATA